MPSREYAIRKSGTSSKWSARCWAEDTMPSVAALAGSSGLARARSTRSRYAVAQSWLRLSRYSGPSPP